MAVTRLVLMVLPAVCSGTMSLRTGEHATLTDQTQVEQLLREKFTGVPADWVPAIAEQVLKETASPAGKLLQ